MLVTWTVGRGRNAKEEAYTRAGHQQAPGSGGGSGPGEDSSRGKSPDRSHVADILAVVDQGRDAIKAVVRWAGVGLGCICLGRYCLSVP